MEATANNKCHQGANVKRWREWRGYNQVTFAAKLGIDPGRLSLFEKKEQLDEDFLVKVAKELEIPLEALTEMEEGATVNIFSGTFNDSATAQNYHPVFNPVEKLIEVFEKMLAEREETIAMLRQTLKKRQ